ncbi:MAG: PTS sugar transporter subunit IIA [Pelolinea sp.]|jgi:PTS system mannose-specific IIA component|nr:PTS sugar transporter subunit IIA [Pelolinea sp.]
MVHLLLITHGQFASGLLDATTLIMGNQPGIDALPLTEEDSIDELSDRLESMLAHLTIDCEGVLIMVDIFGASPCNVAVLSMAKFSNIEVVTGLNLPMLVEVLLQRNQLSLPDLAKLAERSGMEGIKSIRNLSL